MRVERPLSARRRIITTFVSQNPKMSQLCASENKEYGMIVDSSGVYFHPEGQSILAGYSLADELIRYDFRPGSMDFFNQYIYAPLSERFKVMNGEVTLRMASSWSGLYSYSPDISLVMGTVKPFVNTYEIHSDTGKGIMHSYAAASALADLIVDGRYLDSRYDIFSWQRFEELPKDKWLKESLHI